MRIDYSFLKEKILLPILVLEQASFKLFDIVSEEELDSDEGKKYLFQLNILSDQNILNMG